jgi:type II secretory pathway pseudopilin PulG
MMRLQLKQRRSGVRTAFTLFEMMIAVGLCSMLMIAVYSALSIYFQLQTDSHEEIARQQIARALLRTVARDVQSVVFYKRTVVDEETVSPSSTTTDSATTGTSTGTSTGATGGTDTSSGSGTTTDPFSSTGGSSTGTTGTGTTSGAFSSQSGASASSASTLDGNSYGDPTIDPETALANSTSGIIGTSTDLQLFVNKPDPDLGYADSQSITSVESRSSDMILVRYLMAQSAGGGLSSALADKFGTPSQTGAIGLARMQGDLFGLTTAITDSEELPQVSASKMLAKEVSEVQFRYFDGLSWVTEWNSTTLNQMPKAIEIVLTLRKTPTGFEEDDEIKPEDVQASAHRMVIPIPVATPFIVEGQL